MLLGDGFAFIHIPRCGGMAARSVLRGREFGNVIPLGSQKAPAVHPRYKVCADKLRPEVSVFTLIRDPVEWIISFWQNQAVSSNNSYLHRFWHQDANEFAKKLCAAHPEGYVSKLYNAHIRSLSGTRVYRLEDGIAAAVLDATGLKVKEPAKPERAVANLHPDVVALIRDCECAVLKSYGY